MTNDLSTHASYLHRRDVLVLNHMAPTPSHPPNSTPTVSRTASYPPMSVPPFPVPIYMGPPTVQTFDQLTDPSSRPSLLNPQLFDRFPSSPTEVKIETIDDIVGSTTDARPQP